MVRIDLKNFDDFNVRDLVGEVRRKYPSSYLEQPFTVFVLEAKEKTTLPQLRYYWGVVLEDIADQTGYYPDEIHDFNKKLFGLKTSYYIGDEAHELIKGLSKMHKGQAREFIDRVMEHWRGHGIIIREAEQLTREEFFQALTSEMDD